MRHLMKLSPQHSPQAMQRPTRGSWRPAAGATALLIAGLSFASPASAAPSTPRICPQFLTKYCVVTRSGHRMTAETNPCFARQRHWRIPHIGACKR